MKQTNKKQTPSQNKQESPKQNQRGPSTAILQSQCQTNSLPQVIWKSRLAWTNDTYQNSIFTFFSLSPFHTLSSFSDVLCFPFPIFVFLLPSSHFFLILSLFFQLSSSSPRSQSSMPGKDLRQCITFAEACSLLWRELDLHFCAIRCPEASG